METYELPRDVKVFGVQVKTFPLGIGETFEALMKQFPATDNRSYYGVSVCTADGVIYNALAEEKYEGEAKKYGYETYTIPKGEYITEAISDWPQKTSGIKDVFAKIMKHERVNNVLPCVCVEWYKNMQEMLCMIKAAKQKV
jgi:hypothetical protein